MMIKVESKEDSKVYTIYVDVEKIEDCCDDNGNWARRLVMADGNTATYTVCDWRFMRLEWVSL